MAAFAERLRAAAVGACGLTPGETLVVAASGGLDSTVLLRSLASLGWPTVAVYVDHGLRAASREEAAFVEALADELGVPCEGVPARSPTATSRPRRARPATPHWRRWPTVTERGPS